MMLWSLNRLLNELLKELDEIRNWYLRLCSFQDCIANLITLDAATGSGAQPRA